MILSWALIGITVGLLLGITGAGGAIVAVPLFVYLGDASLRDATVLSLLAVMVGAFLNWLVQTRNTDFRIGLLLFLFATLGSALLKPVKALSPEWIITGLFISVALVSLVTVWKKNETDPGVLAQTPSSIKPLLLKSTLGGLSLGGLITMTGLGGGVIIIPFLKGAFNLSLSRAAATSLLTVFLSSIFSAWLQRDIIGQYLNPSLTLALIGGSVASALATRQILKRVPQAKLDHFRKALVTVAILASVGSLLLRS